MIACVCMGLVFYQKWTFLRLRWYTTPDDGRQGGWGRHKTDVMSDWEWKARKRGNMIENEASTGFESMNGLCFSGTATGLNLRNSPKHFNREAEFLCLGGLRLLRIISTIRIFSLFMTYFHRFAWMTESPVISLKIYMKNDTPNCHFKVIIKYN